MADRLGPEVEDILKHHSKKLMEAERIAATTEERAKGAARIAITATNRGIARFLRAETGDGASAEPFRSRVYIAGVFSLLAEGDSSMGRVATPKVVVAKSVNRFNVRYADVSAALANVYVRPEVNVLNLDGGVRREFKLEEPLTPDDIVEGRAKIFVKEPSDNLPKFAGGIGAWVADHDIPEDYMGRDRYVEPSQLGNIAATMLTAMSDRTLNPILYTGICEQSMSRFRKCCSRSFSS